MNEPIEQIPPADIKRVDRDRLPSGCERWAKGAMGSRAVVVVGIDPERFGAGRELPERLRQGLQPHPEGRRATTPPPTVLADFPMILHREDYPVGA